jgi:glycolate oxidase iron-sulfur subunit
LPGKAPSVNSVAIHQPCHFVHAGGDGQALKHLLRRRGVDIALNGTGLCCGGGGVSSLKNPDLAAPLGRAVAETMAASGAGAALAACPGCVLQIGSHLGRLGCVMPALHPLELLEV